MPVTLHNAALLTPSILVVEDEGATRHALSLLLRMNGYSTAAVSSAEEALDAFRGGPWPAFALVDLDLPGMNGLDLISRLHALTGDIYPILLTAADEARVRATLRGQQVVYMQKPVDFERLLSLLKAQSQRSAS
ncbi:MAG TPA: response regulator [Tepidisphaeraceae bacterium]|nr:response regulator [Tepidisphaeraceae bacterium]